MLHANRSLPMNAKYIISPLLWTIAVSGCGTFSPAPPQPSWEASLASNGREDKARGVAKRARATSVALQTYAAPEPGNSVRAPESTSCLTKDLDPALESESIPALAQCSVQKLRILLANPSTENLISNEQIVARAEQLVILAKKAADERTAVEKAAAERANAAENKRILTPVCEPVAFATRSGLIPPRPEGVEPEDPVSREFEDLNGDGNKEWIVEFRVGIEENASMILEKINDSSCYRVLYAGPATPVAALDKTTGEWKDLEGTADAPDHGVVKVVLEFIEGNYKIRKVKSCAGARGQACYAGFADSIIDKTNAEIKTAQEKAARERVNNARQSLPGLFSQCAANKAKIITLKRQGQAAMRSGNSAGARAAFDQLTALEPSWNDTLDKIRDAITIITGDEGPEFEQLIKRVRVECST